jgi:hypothetical protein
LFTFVLMSDNNKRIDLHLVNVNPNTVLIGKRYEVFNGVLSVGEVEFENTNQIDLFTGKFYLDKEFPEQYSFTPMYNMEHKLSSLVINTI